MADRDDRALVLAFQAGDRGAFEELYRRHAVRVRSVCLRMLRNPRDAEEALQESFLRAYLALPRFNGRYRVGPWLARIATNVCLDQLRAKVRAPVKVALGPEHEPLARQEGPERLLVGDEPRLETTLASLAPLHATALRLRAQGYSHREIAARLGATPQQAKALLHRARASAQRAWRQASGWALAPLGGLRSWLSGRGLVPEAELAPTAAAGLGPLTAERVAVSAAAVLLALTPAAEEPRRAEPAPPPPRLAAEDATGPLAPAAAGARRAARRAVPAGTEAAPRPEPGGDGVVERLLAALQRPQPGKARRTRAAGGRHGDEPPSDPSATGAEELGKTAKRKLEDVLPDPTGSAAATAARR